MTSLFGFEGSLPYQRAYDMMVLDNIREEEEMESRKEKAEKEMKKRLNDNWSALEYSFGDTEF